MIVIITVKQPRPDWGNLNVKRFVYGKDFSYFDANPSGVIIDNESICIAGNHMEYKIAGDEITSVLVTY
jgi:hypothetical protein